MRTTSILGMGIAMCLLVACNLQERSDDVSNKPQYKHLIGTQYEVIGPVDAYGIRDHSQAPVEYVTLVAPPGFANNQVAFRVPVALGSRITIRQVLKTNRVFDPPMNLMVQLEGTQLPVHAPLVKISLYAGNKGKGNTDLNPSIYRPVSAGTTTPRSPE